MKKKKSEKSESFEEMPETDSFEYNEMKTEIIINIMLLMIKWNLMNKNLKSREIICRNA